MRWDSVACQSGSAYSATRYDAVTGTHAAELSVPPAAVQVIAALSAAPLITLWPSAGSVRSGNETAIRPSSLVTPSFRTVSERVNDWPRNSVPGLAVTGVVNAGSGSAGVASTGEMN